MSNVIWNAISIALGAGYVVLINEVAKLQPRSEVFEFKCVSLKLDYMVVCYFDSEGAQITTLY